MRLNQSRLLTLCMLSVFFLVSATEFLAAQGTSASILGSVTDTSGGAVPDATVHVTNTGTNATQVTTSDGQGR
jgi:hypothetical protein